MSPQFERRLCRPLKHLEAGGAMYPQAWSLIDRYRAGRGREFPNWPDWCFIPITAGHTVVAEDAGIDVMALPLLYPERAGDGVRIAALAAWRVTQGVYQFAPELFARVMATPIRLDLASDVLFQLPEWCVYVETPGLSWGGETLHGFFAHLESDIDDQRPELRFLFDTDSQLAGVPLHLGAMTMAESLDRMLAEARYRGLEIGPAAATAMGQMLAPFVALVLYLCLEQGTIVDRRGRHPAKPRPKKVRGEWRLLPADGPTYWQVAEGEP